MDSFPHQRGVQITSTTLSVFELFSIEICQYPNQRPLNRDWVNKLKSKQYDYINKYGNPIIVGSFSLIELNERCYMVDGQHRLELLKQLHIEGNNLLNCTINIINYKCCEITPEENFILANEIYFMLNNQYSNNGNIDSSGKVNNNEITNQVLDLVQDRFPKTIKCKNKNKITAPYFDINDLSREINKSRITDNKSASEIFEDMMIFNNNFGETLEKNNIKQYQRCVSIESFFLPYLCTKCEWFSKIF